MNYKLAYVREDRMHHCLESVAICESYEVGEVRTFR